MNIFAIWPGNTLFSETVSNSEDYLGTIDDYIERNPEEFIAHQQGMCTAYFSARITVDL